MGDRFNDYARSRDATPDLRGPLNTDEEDSLDEDTSRHGATTPNEDPNADEPMEIDDYAETSTQSTPTPLIQENDDQRHQVTRAFPHSKPSHRPSAVFRVIDGGKSALAKICNDHQERQVRPRRGSAFVKPRRPSNTGL
ncbi:GL18230 [Drosophila persimilis]|uniref:GL18230 n=1 Tax=Drosophila persimilis TaxID=7234 RepID=B4H4H6_DROPE|nr:GL18230 [Drosophila persimilis]